MDERDPDAPANVLVVEDEPVNRAVLVRAVERLGHTVVSADNGRDALDALDALAERPGGAIDLVLLDLEMPVLDGFEVLETMQRSHELRTIPVVVISAVEESDRVARAIEMGAVDVLSKPFDPVLLRARLATALRESRLRQLERRYLEQEVLLRQRERLATIGELSAGLAHELNNPAAAARRTAERLGVLLGEQRTLLAHVVSRPGLQDLARAPDLPLGSGVQLTPAERMDAEERAELVLRELGVDAGTRLADRIVDAGIDSGELSERVGILAVEDRTLAVQWIAVGAAIERALVQLGIGIGRVSDIVGAMRSYSYLDRAPDQTVDIVSGIEDSLTILAHQISDQVEVVRDHEPDLPAVRANGSELNQVWTNLLHNAFDAVGDRGSVTITTRSDRDRGEVHVAVADDGHGIPADLLGRVFDPFVTTKPPGSGTGLGLNVSHKIVTQGHGGRISVESEPGRTVFTVVLPIDGRSAPS